MHVGTIPALYTWFEFRCFFGSLQDLARPSLKQAGVKTVVTISSGGFASLTSRDLFQPELFYDCKTEITSWRRKLCP